MCIVVREFKMRAIECIRAWKSLQKCFRISRSFIPEINTKQVGRDRDGEDRGRVPRSVRDSPGVPVFTEGRSV